MKFVTKIENCKNRLLNSELYEFKLPEVTKNINHNETHNTLSSIQYLFVHATCTNHSQLYLFNILKQ